MHTKTMEGLIGARTNMNMTNVPMRVFKEARRRGDTGTMERAMGYVNDFETRAYQYKDTAEDGMKEEAKEAREKKKQELEERIEKSREERKELEAQREQERIEAQKKAETNTSQNERDSNTAPTETINCQTVYHSPNNTNLSDETDPTLPKADTIEISSEGLTMSNHSYSGKVSVLPNYPVFYSSSGAADRGSAAQSGDIKLDVSV
ncbi:MAG: DUF1682 domain-containing protein [Lachnospiraceae bacterium]|nr:DUF1682 domain-containing protein [Lachnospiraceae bacterium]